MSKPDGIPQDVRKAAETALRIANTKAHMLAEPTDPIECISRAILSEREACAKHLEDIAKATPLGHANVQRGSSTYNWLTHCASLVRERGQSHD